jgi:hypothetical protein
MTPDQQVALNVGIIAAVAALLVGIITAFAALFGAALGLFGTWLVWRLQRGADQADRIENFRRENLLRLLELLQEYFIVTSKWLAAGRPGDESAEPFYRVRASIDDCRIRSKDEKVRGLIRTLVLVEADKKTTDITTLAPIYVAPCKPLRDRIDELLHGAADQPVPKQP